MRERAKPTSDGTLSLRIVSDFAPEACSAPFNGSIHLTKSLTKSDVLRAVVLKHDGTLVFGSPRCDLHEHALLFGCLVSRFLV